MQVMILHEQIIFYLEPNMRENYTGILHYILPLLNNSKKYETHAYSVYFPLIQQQLLHSLDTGQNLRIHPQFELCFKEQTLFDI